MANFWLGSGKENREEKCGPIGSFGILLLIFFRMSRVFVRAVPSLA